MMAHFIIQILNKIPLPFCRLLNRGLTYPVRAFASIAHRGYSFVELDIKKTQNCPVRGYP
jgi:hypothetical protein